MTEIDITQASIISSMILFPETIQATTDAVSMEWFTGYYRKAFAYMVKEGGADVASLSAAIGTSTVTVCAWMDQEFTTAFLPQHYANLEREHSLRKIQYLGRQLLCASAVDEAVTLIDKFNNSLSGKDKTEPVQMKQGLKRLMSEIERRGALKGQILGMSYGIDDLDTATEGMHKGDLVIVAGTPSMGKTAFAVGALESAAAAGNRALAFSFEMTIEQLLMRSVSAHSGVPLGLIRASHKLQDYHYPKLTDSIGAMSAWPIHIDDPAGVGLDEITRKVKRAKKDGLDLVLIDYLQIMDYDTAKEVQELGRITKGLKNLAKELDVCVVLLSQLNRGSEKDKRKPTMRDLRGSGMIEANADVIIFPYREAADCQKCQDKVEDAEHSTKVHQGKAEIIIGKQRQGERNISVKCLWVGERTRFVGIPKQEEYRR